MKRKTRKRLRSAVGIPTDNTNEVPKTKTLPPPVVTKKPQGPLRRPSEVRGQRLKALRPSLRVDTSFESAEDPRTLLYGNQWLKQIINQKFKPSRKVDKEIYGPTLRTASCYEQPDYGSKHFRENDWGKRVHGKTFQSVLPPIPLFEQFGKTY